MTAIRRLVIAVFVLLLAAAPVMARQLGEAEKASLATTVAAFDAAMRTLDFETIVVTSIPPRMLEGIAKQAGLDVAVLRRILIEQMKATFGDVQVVYFGMDVAAAEHKELPNGEPYVLIPTETVMDVGESGKMRATSHTLALLDGGVWYLLRVAEPQQVAILRQVYPEYADVEFPTGSMEAVN